MEQYGLPAEAADIFVVNRQLGNYFEKAVSELEEWVNVEEGDVDNTATQMAEMAKLAANYLTSDVIGLLAGRDFIESEFKITPENFAEFVKLIYKKEISSKIAKVVLAQMVLMGGDPTDIIEAKGLAQISDESQIGAIVDGILSKNPKAVKDFEGGKQNSFQFLVGQTLAVTQGKANPDVVKKIILEKITKNK